MLRRNARLRREYLYRKNLEAQRVAIREKKKLLKAAVESGDRLPTELRKEALSLRNAAEFDDADEEGGRTALDDEYARAGVEDPRVLITTSRNAGTRLLQFAKEIRLLFPNSQRVNRGNYVLKDLIDDGRAKDFTDVVILHEHRGVPDGMVVCHLPFGPTAYFGIANAVLRHDIEGVSPVSEVFPHLIFDNFTTSLGERVSNILKYLFPVPKPQSPRVITFSNREDLIAVRHHVYQMDGRDVKLQEIGPRFDLKLYQVKLGTIEMSHAEIEWVLRPYFNTAKRRHAL